MRLSEPLSRRYNVSTTTCVIELIDANNTIRVHKSYDGYPYDNHGTMYTLRAFFDAVNKREDASLMAVKLVLFLVEGYSRNFAYNPETDMVEAKMNNRLKCEDVRLVSEVPQYTDYVYQVECGVFDSNGYPRVTIYKHAPPVSMDNVPASDAWLGLFETL